MGTGAWWTEDYETLSNAINFATAALTSALPLGNFIGGVDIAKTGIGVQCDIRIIKASTGEVVWNQRVVGVSEQVSLDIGFISIGNRKLNNNLYAKAMDKAAQKIVDALLADISTGKLFVR